MINDKRQKTSAHDPWRVAEQLGIDVSLIISNLTFSYEERAKKHQQALDLINALKEAKKSYEKYQQSDSSTSKS